MEKVIKKKKSFLRKTAKVAFGALLLGTALVSLDIRINKEASVSKAFLRAGKDLCKISVDASTEVASTFAQAIRNIASDAPVQYDAFKESTSGTTDKYKKTVSDAWGEYIYSGPTIATETKKTNGVPTIKRTKQKVVRQP